MPSKNLWQKLKTKLVKQAKSFIIRNIHSIRRFSNVAHLVNENNKLLKSLERFQHFLRATSWNLLMEIQIVEVQVKRIIRVLWVMNTDKWDLHRKDGEVEEHFTDDIDSKIGFKNQKSLHFLILYF